MERPKNNRSAATRSGILLLAGLVGSLSIGYAPVLADAGMAMLFIRWIPLLMGVFWVIAYFIGRAYFPKHADKVFWVGLVLIAGFVVRAFWG